MGAWSKPGSDATTLPMKLASFWIVTFLLISSAANCLMMAIFFSVSETVIFFELRTKPRCSILSDKFGGRTDFPTFMVKPNLSNMRTAYTICSVKLLCGSWIVMLSSMYAEISSPRLLKCASTGLSNLVNSLDAGPSPWGSEVNW